MISYDRAFLSSDKFLGKIDALRVSLFRRIGGKWPARSDGHGWSMLILWLRLRRPGLCGYGKSWRFQVQFEHLCLNRFVGFVKLEGLQPLANFRWIEESHAIGDP